MAFDTPILFIIFNRPDVTRTVFDRIREVKPRRLFVAADGPRAGNAYDEIKCEETRAVIKGIDWDCEVKTLVRKENLGCGHAVSQAITWFFGEVEQGIILEDDCLPELTFFKYCETLLNYYKDTPEVMHIGGVNFQQGHQRGDASYYFSAIAHVWGWAGWRRAWNKYNFDIRGLDAFIAENKAARYTDNPVVARHWLKTFREMESHLVDTWDYQWTYTVMNNGGVSIIPNVNLISNIGFGGDATHTTEAVSQYADNPVQPMEFPLKHPEAIRINKEADLYFWTVTDRFFERQEQAKPSLAYRIKAKLLSIIEKLLNAFIFNRKNGTSQKNVLIVKNDAIGDYIIGRNFLEATVKDSKYKDHHFYLLANVRLRSLIDSSDAKLYRKVIYFDPAVTRKFKTLYRFYYELRRYRFHTVIHPVYSRTKETDDIISKLGAAEVIGFSGDTSNQGAKHKQVTDRYYTQLVNVDKDPAVKYAHEFMKQKAFFETVLGHSLQLMRPQLDLPVKHGSRTIVVCPGSNQAFKIWSPDNFSSLITQLHQRHPQHHFRIVCGPGEFELGAKVKQGTAVPTTQVNTTDIAELLREIAQCDLVVANDSAPVHIAVALDKPSVCVFNGSRYNRFVPYPAEMHTRSLTVLPSPIQQKIAQSEQAMHFFYERVIKENINAVPVADVLTACEQLLTSIKPAEA